MKNLLFSLVLLAAACICHPTGSFAQTEAQNKAKVAEFYQAFNGDISKFNATNFVAKDFVDHAVPEADWMKMGTDGVSRFQAAIQGYKAGFPDAHFKPMITVADGDYVMVYGESSGTFKGNFMGMEATGKSFKFMDTDIVQFNKEGKAIGHWAVQDASVMMQQIMK